IWPDFEKIQLSRGNGPAIEFRVMELGKTISIDGVNVTPVFVNHLVPTAGLVIQEGEVAVAFTSDTYITDEIWDVARKNEHLKAVFVDVSFPNEFDELAAASKHLTPRLLASELEKLGRDVEVYAIHIKPANRDEVIRQLGLLKNPMISIGEINRVYEW